MPRASKASLLEEEVRQLKLQKEQLESELAGALKVISDTRERERSPRRLSASASHARLSMTCSAMNQVRRWERDTMLEERDAKIVALQATVEKQKEEIASLRRGEGPIGEVLVSNWAGVLLDPAMKEELLAQTRPVNVTIQEMGTLLDALKDLSSSGRVYGGCLLKRTVQRLTEQ